MWVVGSLIACGACSAAGTSGSKDALTLGADGGALDATTILADATSSADATISMDAEADAAVLEHDAMPFADAAPSPDAAALDAAAIPIFVAQGMLGRTTISCDDGRTWIKNRAWDLDGDPLVCGSTMSAVCWMGSETYSIGGQCQSMQPCNDTPDVSKGVTYGAGVFVATWGWGQPGAVRTSKNGIDWTTTHPNDSFGGIAFGGGHFVVASRSPFWSADGLSWTPSATADFRNTDGSLIWSVRRFAFADVHGGRFVAVATGNAGSDMLVSSDGGMSWHRPTSLPGICGTLDVASYGDILSGNGVIVVVDTTGATCRSMDGGDTWVEGTTGVSEVLSRGVFTGSEFWIWGSGQLLKSADGATWTQTPQVSMIRLEGPVARSPSGTLVAIENIWNGYAQQSFLRSTDGLTWDRLPAGAFAASHPIFSISFGYTSTSTACIGP
jgi:hypothetical protein